MTQQNKTVLARLRDYFFKPQEQSNGITSFLSFRFYFTLATYAGSFLLLAHDPFFQNEIHGFTVGQSVTSMILAFITIAALNWELQLFGKPAGANLLLHLFMFFPFTLAVIRLTGFSANEPQNYDFSILGLAMEMLKEIFNTINMNMRTHLPVWLVDMVVNWKICALTILVFFILSLRKLYFKIGGLVFVLIVLVATVIVEKNNSPESLAYTIGGLFLLGIGMYFQWFQFNKTVFWTNITKRLQDYPEIGEREARLIYHLMKDLNENERLTQNDIAAFVTRELGQQPGIREITSELIQRLLYDYRLITIHSNRHGIYFVADLQLYRGDNILASIAVFPRMAIALAFGILWLASPLDMIPDFVPIFGLMDDMAICAFTGWNLKNGIEQNPGRNPEQ